MVDLLSQTNKLRISNLAYVLSTRRASPIVYSFMILFSTLASLSLLSPNFYLCEPEHSSLSLDKINDALSRPFWMLSRSRSWSCPNNPIMVSSSF